MNKKGEKIVYQGPGFCSLLCLLFITLKLTGVISWSWWWVLSPLLIPIGIGVAILIVVLFILLIYEIVK